MNHTFSKHISIFFSFFFLLLSIHTSSQEKNTNEAKKSIDCYISSGDNHFLGMSLAMDSKKSIDDGLKMLKDVFNTKTFYWRGLEEAAWVKTLNYREENYRYASALKWFEILINKGNLEKIVTTSAHKLGMEVWGVSTVGDWGSSPDTPGFNDYPFGFESMLRLEHPEWVPIDKHGYRRQGGTIDLSYPEARKTLVDLHTKLAKEAGYDGVTFVTYVENFSLRFEDEFGFNEPVVQEFKKRYGIDIRTQEFTKSASKHDWYKLRGEYVTLYFKELKESLQKSGIKMGVFLDGDNPFFPMTWATLPFTHPTMGKIYMDVINWIQNSIVDNLLVYGGVGGIQQQKTANDLLWLTRQTPIKISIGTSSPYATQWDTMKMKNVKMVMTLGEDAQYISRSNIPEQTEEALKSGTIYEKMRFLTQVLDGKSTTNSSLIIPLASSDNVILKRLSLLALGKLKDITAVPTIEMGLSDPEIGVKCAAIRALSDNSRSESIQLVIKMIEKNPYHPLLEMCKSFLHRMKPFPKKELIDAALNNPVGEVRTTAYRVLDNISGAYPELVNVFTKGLVDKTGYARYSSAMALGRFVNNKEAVNVLLGAMVHSDPVVQDRAAVSLGEMVLRKDDIAMVEKGKIIESLKNLFIKSGDGSQRSDKAWGYRSVGNALLDCGEEGINILEIFTKQDKDKKLAELAWRVLTYKEKASANKFNLISDKENDALFETMPLFLK